MRQMAAPDFDPELNLHRAANQIGSFRMRMEAWVEVDVGFSLTTGRRLMEVWSASSLLIGGRPLDVIHNQNIYLRPDRFQLQTELLLESSPKTRKIRAVR